MGLFGKKKTIESGPQAPEDVKPEGSVPSQQKEIVLEKTEANAVNKEGEDIEDEQKESEKDDVKTEETAEQILERAEKEQPKRYNRIYATRGLSKKWRKH